MDKDTAIKKIRKCMALAKSSNPNEAATALRQAQKLMEEFGVEHPELLAAEVSSEFAKSTCLKSPPRFETVLAETIAKAFACELIFSYQLNRTKFEMEGGYLFIGVSASPEVAKYTYTVLRRQLAKARADYIKTALKRYKKKTNAADTFCEGWVWSVTSKIVAMVPAQEQKQAITAYMGIHHVTTKSLQTRDTKNTHTSMKHSSNGYIEGKSVTLNRGVGAGANVALLG
ncbi:DUF2786 domain-containing protein [Undibacterium sp. Xuan67W]|uniref:DUF2786 domain-containing protein n=1 Tax=Undibacterium sp. Xuan67W TaxID=3413057 RepID=UPI003BF0CC63